MSLGFEDQVVIITGAGGSPGLGRAYAHLLAELGARVVVNDIGVGPDGRRSIVADAELVADEIRDRGGEAVADLSSVASEEGAQAVVQTALDEWGRVDALINNAGILHVAPLEVFSSADIARMVEVHLLGTIWMCRAVLPVMQSAGYGRIVNTTSESVFGTRYSTIYGAVKSGVYGLTRSLAIEGERYGIRVNALAPMAVTVAWQLMSGDDELGPEMRETAARLSAERVAPTAALLAHRDCAFAGKFIRSEGGRVWEVGYFETPGYENPEMNLDDLAANQDRVVDRDDSILVVDPTVSELADRMSGVRAYVPAPPD